MNEWINQVLSSDHASGTILSAVFLMGLLSVVTCGCNFAVIGVVAGYTGASYQKENQGYIWVRGIAFLAGAVVSMAAIGSAFGYAGELISDSLGDYWKIAAGMVAILFALYSMDLLPWKMAAITFRPSLSGQTAFSAILFGLLVGGLSSALNTCCNPFFPILLAASFVKGSSLWGMAMLTTFALGYAIPLAAMIVGLGIGLGKLAGPMATIGKVAKYAGGTALIILGFYFLITF